MVFINVNIVYLTTQVKYHGYQEYQLALSTQLSDSGCTQHILFTRYMFTNAQCTPSNTA